MLRLVKIAEDPDAEVPELARDVCRMMRDQIARLTDGIDAL